MIKTLGASPLLPVESAPKNYVDGVKAALPAVGEYSLTDGILAAAAAAPTSGRMTFHPAWVAPGNYDALAVSVSTAISGGTGVVAAVGLYADDTTSGQRILPKTDTAIQSGSVSLGTVGFGTYVFASPWSSPGGFYWLGFLYYAMVAPSTAPTLPCISNCTYNIGQTSTLATRPRGWGRTGLTALPTTATTASNATRSVGSDIVCVALRRSA